MTEFNKEYKKLYNSYNKKLLAEHKLSFSTLDNNMKYFITYLKYLRDYYLLTDSIAQAEKISDESEEEVAKKYNLEKKFHWTNFWQLVMTNMEGWSIDG